MYWSPDESLLTTLEDCGILKVRTLCNYHYVSANFFPFTFIILYALYIQLWDIGGEVPSLAHSFDAHSTNTVTWHSEVSEEGDMLLAR